MEIWSVSGERGENGKDGALIWHIGLGGGLKSIHGIIRC